MNNFKQSGPGGLRGRQELAWGRPASDKEYGKKKSFDKKPSFGAQNAFKGGDRGGSRSGDRGSFGGDRGGDRRPTQMHQATCSTCSKPCEVPFRPDGSKPVLCSECFGKSRSDERSGVERRNNSFSNDRPTRNFAAPQKESNATHDLTALKAQVTRLEAKVDQVLSLLTSMEASKATKAAKPKKVVVEEETTPVVAKKAVTKKAAKKAT